MASSRTLPSGLSTCPAAARRSSSLSFGRIFSALVGRLLLWQERSDERLRLREMDDHMLKDLGISRAQAYRESEKPFWRL